VRIAPSPNIPINTLLSSELSTGGTVNHIPRIGAKIVEYRRASPHIHPIAGRQPATNKLLCAASALLTYNWPLANSCACFSAIVANSNAIAFFLSLSSMTLSKRLVTGAIKELNIDIYYTLFLVICQVVCSCPGYPAQYLTRIS